MRRPGRKRAWALGITLTLLALAIGAVGLVLWGAWYAEDKARTKIAELGARAGLSITVGSVVIEPYSFIEVRDVVVTDPSDDVVLARIARVVTDLTLGDVKSGRRMPGQVALEGLEADFTDVGRWRRALERYRGKAPPKAEPTARTVPPTVTFAGARFWVPDPVSGVPLEITAAAARLAPPADGRRFAVSFQGLLEGKTRILVDARLDPQGQDNEGGLTFDPPIDVAAGEGGLHVGLESAYVKQGERVRLRGVRASLPNGQSASADSVELVQMDKQPFPAGTLHLEATGTRGAGFGVSGTAGRVAVDIAPGSANQIPARIRRITVERASGDIGEALAAASVARVEVTTEGIPLAAPLSKVSEIQVSGADVALVLPTADELSSSPFAKPLRALLGATQGAGGGPAEVAPPADPEVGPPAPSAEPAISRPSSIQMRLARGSSRNSTASLGTDPRRA